MFWAQTFHFQSGLKIEWDPFPWTCPPLSTQGLFRADYIWKLLITNTLEWKVVLHGLGLGWQTISCRFVWYVHYLLTTQIFRKFNHFEDSTLLWCVKASLEPLCWLLQQDWGSTSSLYVISRLSLSQPTVMFVICSVVE